LENTAMSERTEADLLPWILAGFIFAAIIAWAMLNSIGGGDATNEHGAISLTKQPPRPLPVSSTELQSHVAASGHPRATRVWECAVDGHEIFSDAPCGDRSTIRELSQVNRMDATPVPPVPTAYVEAYSGNSSDNVDQPTDNLLICEDLKAEVNAIHVRMRSPYTNPEGNYYRGRLHELDDRQFELRCLK